MTKTLFALFLITVLAGVFAAAQPDPTTPESVPLIIPNAEKTRTNPVPPTADSVEQGLELFAAQCAMCHGRTGAGDGDLVPRLNVAVPGFTDPVRMKKRTDGELFYIISFGHGTMSGNKDRLTEEWRWHLVNAIRSMSDDASRSAVAR